jgi:hypothetical protein
MKMKGKNLLIVNEATMVMIVQDWIDRSTFGNSSKVEAVVFRSDVVPTFEIRIEEIPPPPPKTTTKQPGGSEGKL